MNTATAIPPQAIRFTQKIPAGSNSAADEMGTSASASTVTYRASNMRTAHGTTTTAVPGSETMPAARCMTENNRPLARKPHTKLTTR